MPGIGGFRETADPWADGFLGELLFVKWLAEGGQPEGLAWSVLEAERAAAARRRSLMARARGPFSRVRLAGAGEQAQDYFLGLALWVEAAWGPRLLGEALARCPRGTAADFVAAAERLQRERGLLRPFHQRFNLAQDHRVIARRMHRPAATFDMAQRARDHRSGHDLIRRSRHSQVPGIAGFRRTGFQERFFLVLAVLRGGRISGLGSR